MKKEKVQNSLFYKNLLDQQVNSERNIKDLNKIGRDDFDGSILPSFVYSSPAQPIFKKAQDTIKMYKQNMFRDNAQVENKPTRRNQSLETGGRIVHTEPNYDRNYGKFLSYLLKIIGRILCLIINNII